MTEARCLCEQCKMTVQQCRERGKSEAVLDMFFGRLENETTELEDGQFAVLWSDIDCLYRELKDGIQYESTIAEIKELRQQQKEW